MSMHIIMLSEPGAGVGVHHTVGGSDVLMFYVAIFISL